MFARLFRNAVFVAAIVLGAVAVAQQSSPPLAYGIDREVLRGEIRSYLLENPEILVEMFAILEARQKEEASKGDLKLVSENLDAIFDDGFSYVGGNPEASFTIVEFLDYQCTYCRRAHPQIRQLVENDEDIRLIIKEFPILGPNSELASRAAVATLIEAGGDTYHQLNDIMMSTPGPVTEENLDSLLIEAGLEPEDIRGTMNTQEVTDRLTSTRMLAERLAISGTPTFVFEDRMVRGYMPFEQMEALVEEIRVSN